MLIAVQDNATFRHFVTTHQSRAVASLKKWLPNVDDRPKLLHQALHYSTLNGGKRIRPLLIYAIGEALNTDISLLDGPACAVELIHCYSLIHDDLPAMDDDDLRRGKPTCHKAFDEATAILAGDALQALAFQILAEYHSEQLTAKQRIQMIIQLSKACGSLGMAGGQALDLSATGKTQSLAQVTSIHQQKTAALITASVCLAGIASRCEPQHIAAIKQYGENIGLAFQIQDDILDVESSTQQLGKQQGADVALGKSTYPSIVGMEQAKKDVDHFYQQALASLYKIDLQSDVLIALSRYLVRRTF